MLRRLLILGTAAALLVLPGCGGAVDDAIDCADICSDLDACISVDDEECRDACRAEPESEIEECDICLDSEDACADCAVPCGVLFF